MILHVLIQRSQKEVCVMTSCNPFGDGKLPTAALPKPPVHSLIVFTPRGIFNGHGPSADSEDYLDWLAVRQIKVRRLDEGLTMR